MATKLEDSFRDLADRHRLTALTIGYSSRSSRQFVAYAHDGDHVCSQGFGNSIAQAVTEAIADLNKRRSGAALADEALPSIAA